MAVGVIGQLMAHVAPPVVVETKSALVHAPIQNQHMVAATVHHLPVVLKFERATSCRVQVSKLMTSFMVFGNKLYLLQLF